MADETRMTFKTFEHDRVGGYWHVTYEVRDGKNVEVARVDARGLRPVSGCSTASGAIASDE